MKNVNTLVLDRNVILTIRVRGEECILQFLIRDYINLDQMLDAAEICKLDTSIVHEILKAAEKLGLDISYYT